MPVLIRDSVEINYVDTGMPSGRRDADTVFFGHGLLFGSWMFRAQIATLSREYRCVAIDWRGQAASSPSGDGYDMERLAQDAMALMRHLRISPVHYVGLSMGGFVGMRIAARSPELVRSLVLLDTSARAEEPGERRRKKLMAHVYRFSGLRFLRRPVAAMMFGHTFLADPNSEALLTEWNQRLGSCQRSAVSHAVRAVADRAPIADEIRDIRVPTLVVVGADDAATTPEEAAEIAGSIEGARLEQIPECGHSSVLEQPERVTRVLAEFLERHTDDVHEASDVVQLRTH